jgi:hypothetical protein
MPEAGSQNPRVAEWRGHIRALAEGIGPRGPTREGERRGSEYARATLAGIGMQPVVEDFRSARSIFHPHLLGSIGMMAAFIVFPLDGAITLMGLGRDRVAPYWHQRQDTFDKIKPDVLSCTWELANAFVREIDRG